MLLVLGLIATVLALVLVAVAVTAGSGKTTGVARSLELINYRPTRSNVGKHELGARDRLLLPLLARTRSFAERLAPGGTLERLSVALDRAGNPPTWTIERVYGAKGALLIVGVLLGVLWGGIGLKGLIAGIVLAGIGFFLPDVLVYNAGIKRQEELRKGLADALDMLTVCVEAGQGFDGAILQVARSIEGPIAGEFARVLSEIQIGKSRGDAFAGLGHRSTATEVKNFVGALVQADRMGLPIGAVLREQAVQMRLIRRQLAEEKAQKVTVKILFPLLLCIFPALFVVIVGPGAIKIMQAFGDL